jgi:UPF0755 protein
MRRLLLLALASLLLAALGVGAWLWQDYTRFADAPLALGAKERVLDVPLGTPFTRIVGQLRQRGLTDAPLPYWRLLAWQMGVSDGLHAGEYAIEQGLTPRALLDRMARGEVVQHRVTLIEGSTFREIRAVLAKEEALAQATAAMSDAEVMAAVGAAGVHPEGRFLPETYAYTRGMQDLDVLRRARAAMDKALAEAWAARRPGLPLKSPDEMLVLASIVEKETGRADERATIAGVFVRRLEIGMRLQTDPTVIYGVGPSFDGNLTRAHLQTDTPWNTYTRGGLPPTPIAAPGRAALRAVAQPADGDALYFVARGDGSHQFSATLREHNAAVARWQLRRGGR